MADWWLKWGFRIGMALYLIIVVILGIGEFRRAQWDETRSLREVLTGHAISP